MSIQNLVNLTLTEAQIVAVDAALTTLETELAGLVALTQGDKRRMQRMPVWFKDTVKLNLQTILSVSGTTGRALAFGTGMAETTISDFRRGRITPSLFAANEIAEHFGIPIDFLSQTEPAKIVDVCLVRVWQEPEGDLRHFLQKLARSFFQELAQDESEKMLALEAALFPDDAWLSSPEGESHE